MKLTPLTSLRMDRPILDQDGYPNREFIRNYNDAIKAINDIIEALKAAGLAE